MEEWWQSLLCCVEFGSLNCGVEYSGISSGCRNR